MIDENVFLVVYYMGICGHDEIGRHARFRCCHLSVRCDRMKNGRRKAPAVIYAGMVKLVNTLVLGASASA